MQLGYFEAHQDADPGLVSRRTERNECGSSDCGVSHHIAHIIVWLCWVGLLNGCTTGPRREPYTQSRPVRASLVGVWQFHPETVKYLAKGQSYTAGVNGLVLRDDGTFVWEGCPEWWWPGLAKTSEEVRSLKGTWSLSTPKESGGFGWAIGLHLVDVDRHRSASTVIFVRGDKTPYLLYAIIGDPDSEKGMFFVRTSVGE